jgi:hypothetical protein
MPFNFGGLTNNTMGRFPPQQSNMWQNYAQPQQMGGSLPQMGGMGGINPSVGALQGMLGQMNPQMSQMQGMMSGMGMRPQFGGAMPGAMNFGGSDRMEMPSFERMQSPMGGGGIGPSPSFNMMKPPQMGFGASQRKMNGMV